MRRVEAGPTSLLRETVKGSSMPDDPQIDRQKSANENGNISVHASENSRSHATTTEREAEEAPEEILNAQPMAHMRVRGEWVDLRARIDQWNTEGES